MVEQVYGNVLYNTYCGLEKGKSPHHLYTTAMCMIYVRVYINWPALAILWCIRITKYHVVYNKYKHLFHVNSELQARRAFGIVHAFMKFHLPAEGTFPSVHLGDVLLEYASEACFCLILGCNPWPTLFSGYYVGLIDLQLSHSSCNAAWPPHESFPPVSFQKHMYFLERNIINIVYQMPLGFKMES